MSATYREIAFLPEREETIDDTTEFHQVQEKLTAVIEKMKEKDRQAPTLRRVFECDDAGESTGLYQDDEPARADHLGNSKSGS